jgi:hypothetical protein
VNIFACLDKVKFSSYTLNVLGREHTAMPVETLEPSTLTSLLLQNNPMLLDKEKKL